MVNKMKRVLAILLAICLTAGMLTFQASASDNSVQIIEVGGSNPASGRNSDGVSVSKTINPTDKENYFDITLNVSTTKRVDEIYKEQDIAVVLVMDISNTMNEKFSNTNTSRYDAAISAAETFINTFAAHSNGTTANRKLGFVAFNTHGHEIFSMSNCTTTKQANGLIKEMKDDTAKIINQANYSASHERFTNMEAGLKMAKAMLDGAKIDNQYIIFLSDGFPTTYVRTGYIGWDPYMDSSSYTDFDSKTKNDWANLNKKVGADGYFYNQKTGKPVTYGTSYSDKAADKAQAMASKIKKTATIFVVGVDVDGQSITKYENADKNRADKSFSVIDAYSGSGYHIGGKSASNFKTWLKNKIGSGHYYESTSVKELQEVYNNIFAQIKAFTENEVKASWVIKDAMNDATPKVIEFLNFYTKSGAVSNPKTKLTGKAEQNGENTATFANDSINWDMKNSGFTTSKSGNTTYYNYSLTYRVRLKNELAGFVEGQDYKTNGPTSLTYRVRDNDKLSDEKTIPFPIPEVEGYLGDLEFTKLNAKDGKGLAGAQFTLAHNHDCPVCEGTVRIADMTATSDADGKVSIRNIPSGHSYTLTESKTPDGFVTNTETYAVVVSYGTVTVNGKAAADIVNTPVTQPTSLELRAVKLLDGATPETNEFVFQLKDAEGNVLQTVNNSGSNVEFAPIKYTEAGTYTYTVVEVAGSDEDIVYDDAVFTVNVTVVEENYELVATAVTVGSNDAPVFNNETVPPPAPTSTEIVLQATKLLDGVVPETNEFVFQLKDAEGNVLQTVNNSGSNVEFAPIEYTEAGTYTYTIIEAAGDNEALIYDDTVYTVTVTVTEAEGALKAEASYSNIPVFNNETVPPPAPTSTEIVLQATKLLDGVAPTTNEFVFQLKDAAGNVLQTVNNSGSNVEFAPIEYTEAGTYTYTIVEAAGDNEGIVYDDTVYTVTVTVTEAEGALKAEASYSNAPVFNNETLPPPAPTSTEIVLQATKLLDGVAPETNEFVFQLKDAEGNVLQTVNNSGSNVEFAPIEYTEAGTYTYTIVEVAGDNEGIIYDAAEFTVTVQVSETDNGLAAVLLSTVRPVFNNATKDTPPPPPPPPRAPEIYVDVIRLEAMKLLDGNAPADGMFTFELRNAQGRVIATARNRGMAVSFPAITVATMGTSVYTIAEVRGNDDGIVYDETVWVITVEASMTFNEDGDIFIHADVVSVSANGEEYPAGTIPTFYNETAEEPEDPVDPPEDPIDPPEDPVDPPEDPVDPPVEPNDPPVDPTDPVEDPEEPIEIEDPEVPLADVPETGSIAVVWMVLSGVSAAGLIGLGVTRKKKEDE